MNTSAKEQKTGKEASSSTLEGTRPGRVFTPAVDIYENADGLTLEADLPGAVSDSIDINFEDGELSLAARIGPRPLRSGTLLLEEFESGSYFRSFRVSEAIDASRISASYRNGVLSLHLPKVEAVKPRKILVTAK